MSDLIDREALLRQIGIDSEDEPGYYGDTWKFIDTIKRMPSALGTNLAEVGTDCISRQAATDICTSAIDLWSGQLGEGALVAVRDKIAELPPAQPESISADYMKAVWTWLINYQIKAAELKGRYTPYEVLSWVANDWRREHERSDQQKGGDRCTSKSTESASCNICKG